MEAALEGRLAEVHDPRRLRATLQALALVGDLDRRILQRARLRHAAPALEPSLGLIDSDAVQPREERGAALEALDAPPGTQERFLRDLLRLVHVAAHAEHHRMQAIGVLADELLERRPLTPACTCDEVLVGLIRGGHGPSRR